MVRWKKFWLGIAVVSAAVTAVTAAAVSIRPTRDWPSWFGDERDPRRALYARHCAACHGAAGEGRVRGNATALNNPDFLAVASDRFLEATIAWGRRDTEMPAWVTDAGGPLTGKEIRAIVKDGKYTRVGPEFFVREMQVFLGGQRISEFRLTSALSSNAIVRFPVRVTGASALGVVVVNSEGRRWEATESIRLDA